MLEPVHAAAFAALSHLLHLSKQRSRHRTHTNLHIPTAVRRMGEKVYEVLAQVPPPPTSQSGTCCPSNCTSCAARVSSNCTSCAARV